MGTAPEHWQATSNHYTSLVGITRCGEAFRPFTPQECAPAALTSDVGDVRLCVGGEMAHGATSSPLPAHGLRRIFVARHPGEFGVSGIGARVRPFLHLLQANSRETDDVEESTE